MGFKPHIDGHFFGKTKIKLEKVGEEYSSDFLSVVIPLERVNMKNGLV